MRLIVFAHHLHANDIQVVLGDTRRYIGDDADAVTEAQFQLWVR